MCTVVDEYQMYELSLDAQVLLDLQIYQQLTMALLDRKELDDAVQITKDMIKGKWTCTLVFVVFSSKEKLVHANKSYRLLNIPF